MGGPSEIPVRVLACGERLRGDDGVALAAIGLLPADARANAEILEAGQLSVETLLDVPAGAAVVIADAVKGLPPGEIVVLPLAAVARGGVLPASSHALPPDQVIALAAEMRGAAPRGVFVGIGGAEFGFGEGLSVAVAAALPAYASTLAKEIRRLASGCEPDETADTSKTGETAEPDEAP